MYLCFGGIKITNTQIWVCNLWFGYLIFGYAPLSMRLRGCISARICAHFFVFCTFFPLRTIINDASRKITSPISSFHTFPRSDVFWKIGEASLQLPEFRELERGLTPNLGSEFSSHHHSFFRSFLKGVSLVSRRVLARDSMKNMGAVRSDALER